MDSTPAVTAVETANLLSLEVVASKRLLEIAAVEENRQRLDSREIRLVRHSNLHQLLDSAAAFVSGLFAKNQITKSDRLARLEMRNALHSVVPHLAVESPSRRRLTLLHSVPGSIVVAASMDWQPMRLHRKSKRVTAVAS